MSETSSEDRREDIGEEFLPRPTRESDTTTQADMGLSGGTGALPGEGTDEPYGTERDRPDDDGAA